MSHFCPGTGPRRIPTPFERIASRKEKTEPIANVKNAKTDDAEESNRSSQYPICPLRVNHTPATVLVRAYGCDKVAQLAGVPSQTDETLIHTL